VRLSAPSARGACTGPAGQRLLGRGRACYRRAVDPDPPSLFEELERRRVLLATTRETELEMTTEGEKLIIAPVRKTRARVKTAIDEVIAKHAGAFRKVAK